jgi:hypothetical protein
MLTPHSCFSFRRAHWQSQLPPASSSWELKGKGASSPANGCEFHYRTDEESLNTCRTLHQPAASTPTRFLAPGLEGDHQHCLMTASIFTWLWPPSVSPNFLDYRVQQHVPVHSSSASVFISGFAWMQPRSASLSSRDPTLPMQLQTCLITTSKVHLCVHSIIIFRHTSNCSWALPAVSPDICFVDLVAK